MSDNLKDLIAKMKAENSQTTSANTKKKVKTDDEEIVDPIEDDEFVEDDEDEVEEKPITVIKRSPKEVPKETQEDVTLADQIRNLHDEGIYRLELLGVLHQINNNLKIVAGVLVDYKK